MPVDLKQVPTEVLLEIKKQKQMADSVSDTSIGNTTKTLGQVPTELLMQARKLKLEQEQQPIGIRALRGFAESTPGKVLAKVGETVDPYTGAPARSAIGAAQEGKSPLSAFVQQFGEDPSKAPTGKEIAAKAGLSTEETISFPGFGKVSPAGIAGVAVDIVADPLNIVPGGTIAKTIAKGSVKGGKLATKLALKGSAKATDILTKSKTGTKTLDAAGNITKEFSRVIDNTFNPKYATNRDELLNIAKKNNIDVTNIPEQIEFGENAFITRASKARNEGLVGEKYLDQYRETVGQVNNAYKEKIAKIAGDSPPPSTKFDAGKAIEDGLEKQFQETLATADTTYNSIWQNNPGLRIDDEILSKMDSRLKGIEKTARGRLIARGKSPQIRSAGKEIIRNIEQLKTSKGNYKQLVEQMQSIGDIAFNPKAKKDLLPLDIELRQEMYFALSEGLVDMAKKVDPQLGNNLELSNGILTGFFNERAPLMGKINKGTPPEKLFESVVLNGTTDEAKALVNVLPTNELNQVKAAFVEFLTKENKYGFTSFTQVAKKLKDKQDVVKILFQPEELLELNEVVKFGEALGSPVSTTSGPRTIFELTADRLSSAILNEQTIQILKERAKQTGMTAKETNDLIKSVKELGPIGITKELAKKVPRRGRAEIGLKGAQVFSVQEKERKKEKSEAIRRRLRR